MGVVAWSCLNRVSNANLCVVGVREGVRDREKVFGLERRAVEAGTSIIFIRLLGFRGALLLLASGAAGCITGNSESGETLPNK